MVPLPMLKIGAVEEYVGDMEDILLNTVGPT